MNGDGLADASSPANTGVSGGLTDADNDGLLDGWDNDNTLSIYDNGGLTTSSHPDVHNPGDDRDWRDSKDTVLDGILDFLDVDDDNDGIPDVVESFGNDPDGNEDGDEFLNWLDVSDDGAGDGSLTDCTDPNGDGIADIYDFDLDGIPNHLDKDSDNDGLADALDNVDNGSGGSVLTSGIPHPMHDTDGTGNADYLDIDADDDGIVDNIEAQATTGAPLQATAADTDLDGISDVFDPDNGGANIVPVNTESTGLPDYRDTDSDDDGESDLIECWDSIGDGVAETVPANSDTDNDGLDDAFDDIVGPNATTNPSNNGQDALDFPDADLGDSERDWREEPCGNGSVGMAPLNTTTTASTRCINNGWTYYYDPLDPSVLLFAVEHFPAGGNTNPFTLEIDITVSVDPATGDGVYFEEDLVEEQATFIMGRYFNFDITSGSLNGPINVCLFYEQVDEDTLVATAQDWNQANAGGTSFVSGLRWFRVNSGTFDPNSADLQPAGVQNATQLFPTNTGSEEGFRFAEFSTSTLTGGGLGFTVGENSVILPVELISFDAVPVHNEQVLTHWETASEVNNDYFLVERSADLNEWSVMHKEKGAGTSNTYRYYEWLDARPLFGHSYYRLRQIDFDGSTSISDLRDVYLAAGAADVRSLFVYPNPYTGAVFIQVDADVDVTLQVRNSLG